MHTTHTTNTNNPTCVLAPVELEKNGKLTVDRDVSYIHRYSVSSVKKKKDPTFHRIKC